MDKWITGENLTGQIRKDRYGKPDKTFESL